MFNPRIVSELTLATWTEGRATVEGHVSARDKERSGVVPALVGPIRWRLSVHVWHRPISVARMGGVSEGGLGTSGGGDRAIPSGPVLANSIGNKQASANAGLYQSCSTLRDRLWCVRGFGAEFLEPFSARKSGASSTSAGSYDPVTHLWQCFRLGTPLCKLYNLLSPRVAEISLKVDPSLSNANACKALVMRFLIALKERLGWNPDDTFTVSQLYLNDTNGFVPVVRTVDKLLDLLEENGKLDARPVSLSAPQDYLDAPGDQRMHVVRELLESERKYVLDLETMQEFATFLVQNKVLSPDTTHQIFGNLNQLLDVQRRFLICIEDNARRPAHEQRFGGIFRDMEDDFAVYQPFCANYNQALEAIGAETSVLARAKAIPAAHDCYLDPSYELPTFLIKPVQRICKYPLLLEQLMKSTPPEMPWYEELAVAQPVVRRITDKVNETSRMQDNLRAAKDLEERVEDWKGHTMRAFGSLLHFDTFLVCKGDSEREFRVYLFERILLCCKDVASGPLSGSGIAALSSGSARGRSKNNALLKQQRQNSVSTGSRKDARSPLQLKGRIFMNNIVGIHTVSRPGGQADNLIGTYALQIWWRGETEVESFSLKCKNDEQLQLWHGALQRLLDELTMRRQHGASQGSTPALGEPPNLPKLNLTDAHFQSRGARGAFMQVATPIISAPHDLGMAPRVVQRVQSESGQRSDDEAFDSPVSAMFSHDPPVPTRSYTESDALQPAMRSHAQDERSGAVADDWSMATVARTGSVGSVLSTPLQASPVSMVNKVATPQLPALYAHPGGRGLWDPAQHASAPVSPRTVVDASRHYGGPPNGMRKRSLSSSFALHEEMQNLSMEPLSAQGAERPLPTPLAAAGEGLGQRTVSDGPQPRAMAAPFGTGKHSLHEEQPATNSPLSGWNPYFPSVGTEQLGAAMSSNRPPMQNQPTMYASDSFFSTDYSRTASMSPSTSTTTRKSSEMSWMTSEGRAATNEPSTPYSTGPPLQIRVCHGAAKTPMLLPDTTSFSTLREAARETGQRATGTPVPTADELLYLYYMDEDGDRVRMLNEDDWSMAKDHGRMHRLAQLDVLVD